jgi:glutaconate CoA-transferase subunit B
VTDLAVWKPDPETKEFTVVSIHPGVTQAEIEESCSWEVRYGNDVEETPPPTRVEIEALRDLDARTERAHVVAAR